MTLSEYGELRLKRFSKVSIMLLLACLPVIFFLYSHFATPDEELPLLEQRLPATHVLLPLIKNDVDLGNPKFVHLMQGAKPQTHVGQEKGDRLLLREKPCLLSLKPKLF